MTESEHDSFFEEMLQQAGGWETLARSLYRLVEASIPKESLANAVSAAIAAQSGINDNPPSAARKPGRPRKRDLQALWACRDAALRLQENRKVSNLTVGFAETLSYLRHFVAVKNDPGKYAARSEVEKSGIADLLEMMVECTPINPVFVDGGWHCDGVRYEPVIAPDANPKTIQNRADEVEKAGASLSAQKLSIDEVIFSFPEEPRQ